MLWMGLMTSQDIADRPWQKEYRQVTTSTIQEPGRTVPIAEACDVIVCGAGPAGVAAALATARSGSRTCLLEVHGCLGGVWTAGAISWIIDARGKTGIMAEITGELEARGAKAGPVGGRHSFAYDVEEMKLLLEEKCTEAGVRIRLHTRVVGTGKDETRLSHVVTESKSGRQAWEAKAFIDTTGDGDVASLAGCGYDVGHPETGNTQPMSLMALITGVRFYDIEPFVAGGGAEPKDRLHAEMARAGVSPSYGAPTIFRVRDELFSLMANHEYGVAATDADAITEATIRARKELHGMMKGLRGLGGIWEGVRIVATGEQIGVREGRRIHGRYTVGLDDMVNGAEHEDAVCRATFGIDVHSPDPGKSKAFDHAVAGERVRTRPYDIPLRALIARDVDGLMMAGRCISGDFFAHSSYRVTGNAVAMGEAAGKVAALAAVTGRLPHEVQWEEVNEVRQ